MFDLAAAIREHLAKLSAKVDGDCLLQCGQSCAQEGYGLVVDAVLAVLDEHPHLSAAGAPDPLPDPYANVDDDNAGLPSVVTYPGGKGFGCTRCHYWALGAVRDYGWCLTIRSIADQLGISY